MQANSNDTTLPPWQNSASKISNSSRWWSAYRGAFHADWIERARDWRVKLVVSLGLLLAILSAIFTANEVRDTMADRAVAKQVEEKRWAGQGKKNAHSAAHYGIYVFKPVTVLAAIEPGIERYVGSTVWLEAHKQNEFAYRPANDQLGAARQMPLTPAFVLQVLAPLAMIFLGFGLFAAERERGTLRSLRMTAAPLAAIGAARATTLFLAGVIIALPAAIAVAIVLMLSQTANPFTDGALRLGVFTASYTLYLAIWALTIAAISAWAKTTRLALAILVAIWVTWTLVLPRAAVELAEVAYQLPSAQSFRENLERTLGEPHDPVEDAKQKAAILAQYGVTDIKDLPVNWNGINMARGEARGDKIFDQFYGELLAGFSKQSRMMSNFGWVSPAIAVGSAASAAAASDTAHHLRFIQDAETHRRVIQTNLNDFITANPDRDGKRVDGDEALWRSIPPFNYQFPPLQTMTGLNNVAQLIVLLLVAMLALYWRCNRLAREAWV